MHSSQRLGVMGCLFSPNSSSSFSILTLDKRRCDAMRCVQCDVIYTYSWPRAPQAWALPVGSCASCAPATQTSAAVRTCRSASHPPRPARECNPAEGGPRSHPQAPTSLQLPPSTHGKAFGAEEKDIGVGRQCHDHDSPAEAMDAPTLATSEVDQGG